MKFFVPAAKDEPQSEAVWQGSRRFAEENLGWRVTDRRIFKVTYEHDGKNYHAEVGKPDPRTGELILVILESNTFLICTRNRGVVRGQPILVGKEEVRKIEDFKQE